MLGKIGRGCVEEINRFAKAREIPVVRFTKDMVKEDVARSHMQQADREGRCGVVMLGVAQEKAWAWRGWRDGGHDAHPHFEFARQAVFVNHYYFYIFDPEWGPSFIKTNAYAPYPVWIYLNGPRMGETPSRAPGDRVRAAGQRVPCLRAARTAGQDLQRAVRAGHLCVLRPVDAHAALAIHPG